MSFGTRVGFRMTNSYSLSKTSDNRRRSSRSILQKENNQLGRTPKLPQIFTGTVKPPETIRWKSFDSKEISGYIVKPNKIEKKSPVLVFIHGGPQVIDRPTFSSLDFRFATFLGLSIIHTNIRGSRGFGNAFMDADNGAKREDAVRDVSSLLDWIEKQPDLDADNVFIRGESYGGFVALATGLRILLESEGSSLNIRWSRSGIICNKVGSTNLQTMNTAIRKTKS